VLMYGPSEVVLPDARMVSSDRAVTGLCTCRRSRRAALVTIDHDEYGSGHPDRTHSRLFATMMTELGLCAERRTLIASTDAPLRPAKACVPTRGAAPKG
jgi:Iron-containing redox enzyme